MASWASNALGLCRERGDMARPDDNAVPFFLARVLLGSAFVFGAFGIIRSFSEGVGQLRSKHFPMAPWVLGTAVGLEAMGASALIVFLVPVILAYHNFWPYEGAPRAGQVVHFLKNIAIVGGLLAVITCPPKSAVPFEEKNERT